MDLKAAERAEPSRARARVDVEAEGGTLVASRCADCGATSWPSRAICSACGSPLVDAVRLPRTGSLTSFTRVWVPRGDLPVPYVLGQVAFGAGATVFAHVRGLDEAATVPAPVRVVLSDDPDAVPRFWFEPAP
jgi:uncharacterized protein